MSKRIYISGPITGLKREEYMGNFRKAEELLRKDGYHTVNPTRKPPCRWPWLYRIMGYRATLLYDLWLLLRCDYIYKMPGWKESRGAQIESCVAYHMKIFTLPLKVREVYDKKICKWQEKRKETLKIEN